MKRQDPYSLLKEARESWEYIEADDIVYYIEDVNGQLPNIEFRSSDIYSYAKGELWLEFLAQLPGQSHANYVLGIIESKRNLPIPDVQNPHAIYNCELAMLVEPVNLPQRQEVVHFRHQRSVIRLKPLDCVPGFAGEEYEVLLSYQTKRQRELNLTLVNLARKAFPLRQFPSDVVEGSSEVVGDVTNCQSPLGGGSGHFIQVGKVYPYFFPYRIGFWSNGGFSVEYRIEEDPLRLAKLLVFLLRPFYLGPSPVQWFWQQDRLYQGDIELSTMTSPVPIEGLQC